MSRTPRVLVLPATLGFLLFVGAGCTALQTSVARTPEPGATAAAETTPTSADSGPVGGATAASTTTSASTTTADAAACGLPGPNQDAIVAFVQRLRQGQLTKVPGVAETIDWAAALLALGAARLTPELIDDTLGVVLKYEEDVRAIRGATARAFLEDAVVGVP